MDRQELQGLLILLCCLPALAVAGVYQWRDAGGKLHFGDRPPETVQAVRLETAAASDRERLALAIGTQQFELGPEAMNRVRSTLPQILHIYRSLFRLDIRDTVEVKLSLLASKPAFDAWLAARGIDASMNITGVYLTKTREVAVWHSGVEDDVVNTILHESSHVIMGQLSPMAPSWLQEGMAEYLEQLQEVGGRLRVRPSEGPSRRIRHWLESGELISLRTYLGIPEREWRALAHDAGSAVPYTVAWATVYFMLSDETGRTTLRRILQDLEKSQRWPTLADLDQRYPGGVTRMDYEFFRWAQKDIAPHWYEMP